MAAAGDNSKDLKAHQSTYSGFLTFCKVGSVAVIAVTAIVILLIAN